MVNLVSKQPTAEPREVQLSYGSHNRRQLGVDISGPLTDADNVLGRLVMLGRTPISRSTTSPTTACTLPLR